MQYPTEVPRLVTHLRPDEYDLGSAANTAVTELATFGFTVFTGISPMLRPFVAKLGAEKGIREFCPNDATQRFRGDETLAAWTKKGRGAVAICSDGRQSNLAAYGWSGPEALEQFPADNVTTAYRVGAVGAFKARYIRSQQRLGNYEMTGQPFRLGLYLGKIILGTAVHIWGADPNRITLETWKSNTAARKLYADLGFEWLPELSETSVRPTLQRPGSCIQEHTVYIGSNGHPRVRDTRCFYRLGASAAAEVINA